MLGRRPTPTPVPRTLVWLLGGALCAVTGLVVVLVTSPPQPRQVAETGVVELHGHCQDESLNALQAAIAKGHRSLTAAGIKTTAQQLTRRVITFIRTASRQDGRCIPLIDGYVRVAIEDGGREPREVADPRTP